MRVNEIASGESQMARVVRAFDWSKTPLGPYASWPISLKTIVEATLDSNFPQAVVWGPEFTTIHNDAFLPILGKKPAAIGQSFADIWSEAWDEIGPIAAKAYAGTSTFIENHPLRINRNGYDELAHFTFCYSPIRDDDGNIAGMIDTVMETTEVVRGMRAQDILRRELVHRVKNTMAVASAVVSASIRHATSLEMARETITKRIEALGKIQNLLSLSDDGVEIGDVVMDALGPHLDSCERAVISGPAVLLSAEQAMGLSLAMYELATNAAKYGALSEGGGRILVDWAVEPGKRFTFTWQETGGPPVSPPSRTGFGSRLTKRIVAAYFFGKAEARYEVDGLFYQLTGSLTPTS